MTRVLLLCSLALLCSATLFACAKKSDTPPATTDTPAAGTESFATQPLAEVDGAPVTMTDLFRTPEIRADLIQMRNQDLEMQLIRAKYDEQGLTFEEAAYTAWLEELYQKMGIIGSAEQTAQEKFEAQVLLPQGMEADIWRAFSETQFRAEQLLEAVHPITDAELEADFAAVDKKVALMQMGPQQGWTSEEDITLEALRPMLAERAKERIIGELTTQWGKEAREGEKLVINRLPSEILPPDTPLEPGAVPDQAPAADDTFQAEPVAYVLNGKNRTWDEIWAVTPNQSQLPALFTAPLEQAVVQVLWADSGLTLSDTELAAEHAELMEFVGGEEEFERNRISKSMSDAEMTASVHRYALTKRLLAKAFPVSEAEVEETFATLDVPSKMQLASRAGMVAPAESDLTLENLKSTLREALESQSGNNRGEWLIGELNRLIDEERLVLKDPRVKIPEPPQALPQIQPHGAAGPGAGG